MAMLRCCKSNDQRRSVYSEGKQVRKATDYEMQEAEAALSGIGLVGYTSRAFRPTFRTSH